MDNKIEAILVPGYLNSQEENVTVQMLSFITNTISLQKAELFFKVANFG